MSMNTNSVRYMFLFTVGLCLFWSIVVSIAAVGLRPKQIENKIQDRQNNVLEVAGLDHSEASRLQERVIDLKTGEFVETDAAAFDQRVAADDPEMSRALTKDEDIAGIGRESNWAKIYLVNDANGALDKVVLPIHGYGLWSTLYGFISVEEDGNTIYRLKFYEHAETPGLGGEVDNIRWREKWTGKKISAQQGDVDLTVVKGAVLPTSSKKDYEIDGLSGATLTSRGVDNMIKFWLGEQGFAPYLATLQTQ